MLGPIDYIIVGFTGNKFDGSILKAISEAIDKGIIDLVALSLIHKDANETVKILDIADLGDEYVVKFTEKYKVSGKHIAVDDINEVADLIEPNSSAGLLIIEQLWAKPLKKALLDANGFLIAEGRIHPDAADELSVEREG
jgi:hypothetical protein